MTDEVLQYLVDKYHITYQNIWGEGVVRPLLVELGHYKILEPRKDAPYLSHFLHEKRVLVTAATWKRISTKVKLTKILWGKGSQTPRKIGWCDLNSPHALQTSNFRRWKNIWEKGVARLYLVWSSYCKTKVKTAKHQMMQVLHIAKFIMNGIKKEKCTLKLLILSTILLKFKLP